MSNFVQTKEKIAVIFHFIGPYHFARLNAASKHCALTALELSEKTIEYDWEKFDRKRNFERTTIFTNLDSRALGPQEILSKIYAALDKTKPSAVFINGWADKGALSALLWCQSKGVPAIVMSESQEIDEIRPWWKEAIKKRVVGMFSGALVGGEPHIEYLSKLGMETSRIFTGYDVVENDHFSTGASAARVRASEIRASIKLPDKYFLASNRFIEKKNLPRLLRAYSIYRNKVGQQAWKLVLLGDGPLRTEIVKLLNDLVLNEHIYLPGFIQYDELPMYYGLASAFVHASTTEQWGLVVNEAMAAGLPVLVSERCGCARDLVKNGVNGFTFDPYDVAMLANLMQQLSADETALVPMGKESREIISHWSPDTFGENLLRVANIAGHSPVPTANYFARQLLNVLINL